MAGLHHYIVLVSHGSKDLNTPDDDCACSTAGSGAPPLPSTPVTQYQKADLHIQPLGDDFFVVFNPFGHGGQPF
jgi:hypothetical protein